jgi:hypothetical protein
MDRPLDVTIPIHPGSGQESQRYTKILIRHSRELLLRSASECWLHREALAAPHMAVNQRTSLVVILPAMGISSRPLNSTEEKLIE